MSTSIGTNCELWHWHPDFKGWSATERQSASRPPVLFVAFERLLAYFQAMASGRGAQVFVGVKQHDSSGDALYLPHAEFR